jgi:DNA-binding transcriptional ArsR family regulator
MKQHVVPPTPNSESLAAMVETFKALADPTRAQIVLILTDSERSVGDLVELLEAQQSTVSRHLAVLRAARLVQTRRETTHIYYRLSDAHVGDLVHQAFSHAEHERLGLPDHDQPNSVPTRGSR